MTPEQRVRLHELLVATKTTPGYAPWRDLSEYARQFGGIDGLVLALLDEIEAREGEALP